MNLLRFSFIISSRRFIILPFTLCVAPISYKFLYMVWGSSWSSFLKKLQMSSRFGTTCWKDFYFSSDLPWHLCWKSIDYSCVFIFELCFLCYSLICLYLCKYHTALTTMIYTSLEIRYMGSLILFFSNYFDYCRSYAVPCEF